MTPTLSLLVSAQVLQAQVRPSAEAMTPHLFSVAAGILAVAGVLTAAAVYRNARLARRERDRLRARLDADLTSERVFVLHEGQPSPASPTSLALFTEAVPAPELSNRTKLRQILGPELSDDIDRRLSSLIESGEAFEICHPDAEGTPLMLRGEIVGAKPVLRFWPVGARSEEDAYSPDDPGPVHRVLDIAPSGILIFDHERRLRVANRSALRMLNLASDWVEGAPSLRSLLDALRSAGRVPERSDYAQWRNQILSDPVALLNLDGAWTLPNGDALRLTASQDGAGGFVVFINDLSGSLDLERDLKGKLAARQAALEGLVQGLAMIGNDGKLILANPAFAQILDLPAQSIAPQSAFSALAAHFEAEPDCWRAIVALFRAVEPQKPSTASVSRLRADQSAQELDLHLTPLPDGALLLSVTDQTPRHQLEAALRDRQEALLAADRMKSEFLVSIAYQLRTPLNTVIGFAEMLAQGLAGELPAKQLAYINNIVSASEELRLLVNDSLDLGALQAGTVSFNRRRLDLVPLVETVVASAEGRIARRGALLSAEFEGDEVIAYCDETRVKHALFSILGAVIGSLEAADRVLMRVGADQDRARLDITYQPAKSSGQSRPFDLEGIHGVSLSLAQRLIERQQGSFVIEETDGVHGIFTTLPLNMMPEDAPGLPERQGGAAA
ncbi:MAG: PAS-domain containing protein [Neomegalonema sp.]|nr:PAS-domain containing protein [Neomegalonema sp.]